MLPEDLKSQIYEGTHSLEKGDTLRDVEGIEDVVSTILAVNVAELAYQRGRKDEMKECAKIANEAAEVAFAMYKGGGESYAEGRCDEAFEIAEAIEARGKE